MNYFAHACLALRHRADARFALGAMLPDWMPWLGAQLTSVSDRAVSEGVDFHHASDAAFHTAPRFATLLRDAVSQLSAAGLPRGPARGAAHVGVELLLDGALLEEPRACTGYLAAIGTARAVADSLAWSRPEGARSFAQLCRHLDEQGLPRAYGDPEQVALRTARTLARRPRLRVPVAALPALIRWAREAQPALRDEAPHLLAETESRL
jgi:hypothetical protein